MKKQTAAILLIATLAITGCAGQNMTSSFWITTAMRHDYGNTALTRNPYFNECFGLDREKTIKELNKLFRQEAKARYDIMPSTITLAEDKMHSSEIDINVVALFIEAHRKNFNATAPSSPAARDYCMNLYSERKFYFTSIK